jgi:predicted phosphodiesterase
VLQEGRVLNILNVTDTHFGHDQNTYEVLSAFVDELAGVISTQNVKALVHNGDWISCDPKKLKKVFRLFRSRINIPIMAVFGNHDLWTKQNPSRRQFRTLPEILRHRALMCKEFAIVDLGQQDCIHGGVVFCGFDGWYAYMDVPTNDHRFLPSFTEGVPTHQWLQRRAVRDLGRVLDSPDLISFGLKSYKKVCVTHFGPPIGDHAWPEMCASKQILEVVAEKFDYFLIGHSHQKVDQMVGNCRVINPGGDYNKPSYSLIEIV